MLMILIHMKYSLEEFKRGDPHGIKMSQEQLGAMFGVCQATISGAIKSTKNGTKRFHIEKLPKQQGHSHSLYALKAESTVGVGALPWE
tara:strand:- start:4016 stop:4279 length:264 start_codon:yes stop_codon:yes gene_type:complete